MRCIIGIDGGGSNTDIIVADLKGNILSRVRTKAFEYIDTKSAKSNLKIFFMCILHRILADMGMKLDDCEAIYIGMSGVETKKDCKDLEQAFKEEVLNIKVKVVNDIFIAFNAATGGDPGVVIIAGTGSVAYGKNNVGKTVRIGGLGPIIGDEGSGYDIGLKGILAAIKSEDGRGSKTIIEDIIKKKLGLNVMRDIQFLIYRKENSRELIASIAEVVKKAADLGDQIALDILYQAGIELGKLAISIIETLGIKDGMVIGMGSIFINYKQVYDSFKAWVLKRKTNINIMISKKDPVEGTILWAIRDLKCN